MHARVAGRVARVKAHAEVALGGGALGRQQLYQSLGDHDGFRVEAKDLAILANLGQEVLDAPVEEGVGGVACEDHLGDAPVGSLGRLSDQLHVALSSQALLGVLGATAIAIRAAQPADALAKLWARLHIQLVGHHGLVEHAPHQLRGAFHISRLIGIATCKCFHQAARTSCPFLVSRRLACSRSSSVSMQCQAPRRCLCPNRPS